jgi:acetyl esterase/lipase
LPAFIITVNMRILLLFFLSLLLASCQKETTGPITDNSRPQTYPGQSYGADPQQKMDIFLPAQRSTATTKAIVLIHGGAWTSGDKADFDAYVDTLKRRLPAYAIFNINYRLATATMNLFPAQENDVKQAINYILAKAAEFGISQKLVLLGASAGGHLALLEGFKNAPSQSVRAIVDFFGPADMTEMYTHPANPLIPPAIEALFGGTPATKQDLYSQSSPINFITSQSPPTIIFQGGLDPLVPVAQSASLNAKLQSAGVAAQYVFYPVEGHGWTGSNLVHSFDQIEAFLAAHAN